MTGPIVPRRPTRILPQNTKSVEKTFETNHSSSCVGLCAENVIIVSKNVALKKKKRFQRQGQVKHNLTEHAYTASEGRRPNGGRAATFSQKFVPFV